jgi:nicotinate-nucleotide--dimethylbenzimidazole phosphoribosyltransferase
MPDLPTSHARESGALPNQAAREQAHARQQTLTKPAGALGRLEELSIWLAGVQGICPPHPFRQPAVVIFAGDHGVARTSGTSAYPPEVTAQMVGNFVAGGAAANVIARHVGASVIVVDVSVDSDPRYLDHVDSTVSARRVRRGAGSIDVEDAMTEKELATALALGRTLADEQIDAGADVLIAGDMGIGNTTPAAAIVATLTGRSANEVTGRGTGIDDATLARKVSTVQRAIDRCGDRPGASEVVRRIGGPDIAAMVGFLQQSADRGVPVILDGIVSCSAALAASDIQPAARLWWVAGHASTEPAALVAMAALGLEPVLTLDLRLGEGTGALLALPLLNAAAATLAEMATFDSAGVSDRAVDD